MEDLKQLVQNRQQMEQIRTLLVKLMTGRKTHTGLGAVRQSEIFSKPNFLLVFTSRFPNQQASPHYQTTSEIDLNSMSVMCVMFRYVEFDVMDVKPSHHQFELRLHQRIPPA
jgi:hypothetical protein